MRVRRGVYHLSEHPRSPLDGVFAAWLTLGPDKAVVSHETALHLLGLTDDVPDKVHLTIARTHRRGAVAGIALHTTTNLPSSENLTQIEGLPVTSAARSIVDTASGGAEELVTAATRNAVRRGLITRTELLFASQDQSGPTRQLIRRALQLED